MARGQCGHNIGLVAIECRRCRRWFFRCRRCYHGHRYCGKRCRKAARKAQKAAGRQRHIDKDPEAARRDNADRQSDYRRRQRDNPDRERDVVQTQGACTGKVPQVRPDSESVTDQGPTPSTHPLSVDPNDAHASGSQKGPRTGRPRGRQRCQGCGRYGRVVLWVRRFDKTPSFRRLL